MTRPDDVEPVPDLYLERYRLGELPEDERGRIERLLALDPELGERLAALRDSDAEVGRRYPAPLMDEQIRARAAGAARRVTPSARRGAGWLAPALAAATVVVLAVGLSVMRPPAPGDGIRLKGGRAELIVYRKTAAGTERLEPGAAATAGDLIRVGYRSAGRPYGAIVSTDGNGNVTQHLPRSGGRAVSLETGKTVLLGFSYELDHAPRWERFYLITSEEPFELEPVRRAARAVAADGSVTAPPPLSLAADLDQTVFTLTKESVS